MLYESMITITDNTLDDTFVTRLFVTQPDKEKSDKEKPDREKSDKEKPEREKSDKEKPDKEKSDKEKSDKEKSDKEKPEKEKLEEPKENKPILADDRKEKLPLDSEVIPVAKAKKRIPFNKGRPNIEKEFSEIATIHAASIKRHAILAFVCGPAPLVSSIALETYKHNFMYHSETFEL